MSLIQKIKSMINKLRFSSLEPGLGDPQLKNLVKFIETYTGQALYDDQSTAQLIGPQLEQYLGGLRAEKKWNEFSISLKQIFFDSPTDKLIKAIEIWTNQNQNSSIALLVRGYMYLNLGFDARGYGTSDTVTDEGASLLEMYTEKAEQDFLRVIELDSSNPTPYHGLLRVAQGISLEEEQINQYYQAGVAIAPEHWFLNSLMVNLLAEKWYGTHDKMFDFTRRLVSNYPQGSILSPLILDAHIERWMYPVLSTVGLNAEKYMNSEQRQAWYESFSYFKQPDVQKECRDAYEKFSQVKAKYSKLALVEPKNYAAFWFYQTKEVDFLKRSMIDLSPQEVMEYPWIYDQSDSIGNYHKAVELAGL